MWRRFEHVAGLAAPFIGVWCRWHLGGVHRPRKYLHIHILDWRSYEANQAAAALFIPCGTDWVRPVLAIIAAVWQFAGGRTPRPARKELLAEDIHQDQCSRSRGHDCCGHDVAAVPERFSTRCDGRLALRHEWIGEPCKPHNRAGPGTDSGAKRPAAVSLHQANLSLERADSLRIFLPRDVPLQI